MASMTEQPANAPVLPGCLDHHTLIARWKPEANREERQALKRDIEGAVVSGALKAAVEKRKPVAEYGFERVPRENWQDIRDGWIAGAWVRYSICREDFQAWLEGREDWPLPEGCPLSQWWTTRNENMGRLDSKPEALPPETQPGPLQQETTGTPGSVHSEVSKGQEPDCLLSPPQPKNDWYVAIRDTVHAFLVEHGRCPEEAEAWARLRDKPPPAYGIVQGKTRYDTKAVLLGGDRGKGLTRAAFRKRWRRYTSAN